MDAVKRLLLFGTIGAVGCVLGWVSGQMSDSMGHPTREVISEIFLLMASVLIAGAIVGAACVKASGRTLGIVGAVGCVLLLLTEAVFWLVPDAYPVVFIELAGLGAILGAAMMLMTLGAGPSQPKPPRPRTGKPTASA